LLHRFSMQVAASLRLETPVRRLLIICKLRPRHERGSGIIPRQDQAGTGTTIAKLMLHLGWTLYLPLSIRTNFLIEWHDIALSESNH
jgi:hypothetical protein